MSDARDDIKLAVMDEKLSTIEKVVGEIKSLQINNFVNKVDFETRMKPLERLVYGLVGLILIAVVGALLGLVIIK